MCRYVSKVVMKHNPLLEQLAQTISNKVIVSTARSGKILHWPAVFANNFPNYLLYHRAANPDTAQLDFELSKAVDTGNSTKGFREAAPHRHTGPADT